MDRLENKIDSIVASLHDLDKKVDRLSLQVEDIQERTIAHDNLTAKLDGRVDAIESLAVVPRKIFDFVWKLSLFVGVVYSVIKFLKS